MPFGSARCRRVASWSWLRRRARRELLLALDPAIRAGGGAVKLLLPNVASPGQACPVPLVDNIYREPRHRSGNGALRFLHALPTVTVELFSRAARLHPVVARAAPDRRGQDRGEQEHASRAPHGLTGVQPGE